MRATDKIKDRKQIKRLYEEAFPRGERLPFWVLRLLAKRRGIRLTAYYEGDTLCGFAYTVEKGRLLYLMFLAVRGEVRSRGYGSEILTELKRRSGDKTVVLCVEPLEDGADNGEQRRRRIAFYEKNGFCDTGYQIDEIGGRFTVMATEASIDPRAYHKIFRKLSFGFWGARIYRDGQLV